MAVNRPQSRDVAPETLSDWLGLHLVPGLGTRGANTLIRHFGSPAAVLAAPPEALAGIKGVRKSAVRAIAAGEWRRLAEEERERAGRRGVTLLCPDDSRYPPLLGEIFDPPLVLYVKGDPLVLSRPGVAVVGSRAATVYGGRVAHRFAGELAAAGVSVISGLALGIDTAAHQGAVEAAGRRWRYSVAA